MYRVHDMDHPNGLPLSYVSECGQYIFELKRKDMKKVLMLFDCNNFPKGAFRFIKELQRTEPVHVTAAILHAPNFEALLPTAYAMSVAPFMELQEQEKTDYLKAKEYFINECVHNDIDHSIHEESMQWNITELVKETRFADFVIMSAEVFYPGSEEQPNGFMHQLLTHTECPMLLFPESFRSFKEIIIAYDGSRDAVFALKEFFVLFPQFKTIPARIVYAKNDTEDSIPDLDYLLEYATRHFDDLEVEKLHFNEKKFFNTWLSAHPDAFIITGSFGHGDLGRILRMSFAENLIREHANALFIAHK